MPVTARPERLRQEPAGNIHAPQAVTQATLFFQLAA